MTKQEAIQFIEITYPGYTWTITNEQKESHGGRNIINVDVIRCNGIEISASPVGLQSDKVVKFLFENWVSSPLFSSLFRSIID